MREILINLLNEVSPKYERNEDGVLVDHKGNAVTIEGVNEGDPVYKSEYEQKNMQNVKVSQYTRDQSFVYIEEFVTGKYDLSKFFNKKVVNVELYFCKFVPDHIEVDANVRQNKRDEIEADIVMPFVNAFESMFGASQGNLVQYRFMYPPAMYDDHEVGITLLFDLSLALCSPLKK